MRSILSIALLLLGFGLLSCRLEGTNANPALSASEINWVRTVDGWEHSHDWSPSLAAPPALHPLVLAVGQTLFSLLGLVAFAGSADIRLRR
jgi:hypothetical protein